MNYLGDFGVSAIVDTKFCTVDGTGAPTSLSSGAVSIYKGNSTTQSTAGVTLTADFDGVTGLNHLRIDTSADGTFYAVDSLFQAVITTGTVGGVSVVGYVPAEFSISTDATQALLTTTMTESYATDGSQMTLAQALYMIKQSLHEMSVSSTTMTVKKLDGSTTAMTFTLNDATNPTSITRAT